MTTIDIVTSESVAEGHPDKVADYIADSILDAHLTGDPHARVACEVLCKGSRVVLAGEITSRASVDVHAVVRAAVREVGYDDPDEPFSADRLDIDSFLTEQSAEIGSSVSSATDEAETQGAGDQGMMYGYATRETTELMPLPALLAHRLAAALAADRRAGAAPWLRPDAKTQVTVEYRDGQPARVLKVVVSTQHRADRTLETVRQYVRDDLVPRILDGYGPAGDIVVNPAGAWTVGGPTADAGVTGRKIIVDTYGGVARHGGGAFSGKDPSKVDRSAAYFCRYVARRIVDAGICERAEVRVAYAIGHSKPVALDVETFGTGDPRAAREKVACFDFSPAAIIRQLDLLRPIYRSTTNYGHFGRPGLPWEG